MYSLFVPEEIYAIFSKAQAVLITII